MLKYIPMPKRRRGKLIVIEGLDASGKATQSGLLLRRLRRAGYKTAAADFPQYDSAFFGAMVGQYLKGEFGRATKVNAYLASLLYAFDRWEAKPKLDRWLNEGRIIVANRYTTSNALHQTAKIKNNSERKKYLDWLAKVEYKVLGVPQPDLVIFLSVPHTVSRRLAEKRGTRGYIGQKLDGHEKSRKFQQDGWENAQRLIRSLGWKRIDCVDNGKMLSRESVGERVWQAVRPRLK